MAYSAAAESAGRARAAVARGPQRVRMTPEQDSTPSTTVDEAASAKKPCA